MLSMLLETVVILVPNCFFEKQFCYELIVKLTMLCKFFKCLGVLSKVRLFLTILGTAMLVV